MSQPDLGLVSTNLKDQENLNKKLGNASALESLYYNLRQGFEPVKTEVGEPDAAISMANQPQCFCSP